MAWIQKRGGVYWLGWRHNGEQFRKSLKTSDRATAEKEKAKLHAVKITHQANAITGDFIAAITGKPVSKKVTASEFLKTWLLEAKGTTSDSTYLKYQQVEREFSESINAHTLDLRMDEITAEHVRAFLAKKRLKAAPGTVKGFRRILSSIFLRAQNMGLINGNPVALVKSGSKNQEQAGEKRPFTLAEIRDLHSRATSFWKYMIQAGFFTGQSLGDLITLRPASVDLSENIIRLNRRKTGKRVIIPMAKPLRELLVSIWPKKKAEYFWPEQAERYLTTGASSFSQEFYALLSAAGMVSTRAEKSKSTGKGRAAKRAKTILGFHNLRHTFVTQLKVGGAVDSVAKELAGHSSTAMNTHYTHLPIETLSKAVNQLPEVTG